MLNQKAKDDAIMTIIVLFFVAVGCVCGWWARSANTNDRYLRAAAERFFATAAYYDAETAKLRGEK